MFCNVFSFCVWENLKPFILTKVTWLLIITKILSYSSPRPHTLLPTASSFPVPSPGRQDPTLAPYTLFSFSASKDFKGEYVLCVYIYIANFIYIFMCMDGLPVCISVSHIYSLYSLSQKSLSLGVKLQSFVNCYEGAGNGTQVLCKNIQ